MNPTSPAVRSADPVSHLTHQSTVHATHVSDPSLAEDVALVAWPAEAERRGTLAAASLPRLLLIDADAPPPVSWDDLEDWARLPVRHDELVARARVLLNRRLGAAVRPVLDSQGIVRVGKDWAAIPPIEARVLALLLEDFGQVVDRQDLVDAGWPEGTSDERILDSRIKLLRRRLQAVGLEIVTVRGAGLLVQFS